MVTVSKDSGRPRQHRRAATQVRTKVVESPAGAATRDVQGIPDGLVDPEHLLRLGFSGEIHLVDHDTRSQRVGFGDDEEPIEHGDVGFRLAHGKHDHHLIDIGGQHPLSACPSGLLPRQA
jgi:hypothetical protein